MRGSKCEMNGLEGSNPPLSSIQSGMFPYFSGEAVKWRVGRNSHAADRGAPGMLRAGFGRHAAVG